MLNSPLRPAERDRFDVAVIGAGPAGSAAAIRFRQINPALRVALVDKAVFPRDKTCGDGLGPGVTELLDTLGVDITGIGHANKIVRAEIHGPDGLAFTAVMPGLAAAPGMTARRSDFDQLLVTRAAGVGVTVIDGTRFVSHTVTAGDVEVKLKDDSTRGKQTLRCRLLVAADGANSRVRRSAGMTPPPPQRTGIARRAYVTVPDQVCDRIVLSFEEHLRPGYGWCFPFADGTANVGVGMVLRDYRRSRPDLDELLGNYLTVLNSRGIQTAEQRNEATYTLPVCCRLPPLTAPRMALIGDAAAMINAFTGEGVLYGMAAGIVLAEHAACAVGDPAGLHAALCAYDRRFRRRFGLHFMSNYAVHRLMRHRAWARMAVSAAAGDIRLQTAAADLMFSGGRATITSGARIARRGLRYLIRGADPNPVDQQHTDNESSDDSAPHTPMGRRRRCGSRAAVQRAAAVSPLRRTG